MISSLRLAIESTLNGAFGSASYHASGVSARSWIATAMDVIVPPRHPTHFGALSSSYSEEYQQFDFNLSPIL